MATPEGARALISSKYLPEGLGLMDPSRMKKSEVETYYTFWMARQKEDKKPLVFKSAEVKQKLAEDRQVRLDALKSKKRAYVEVDVASDDAGAGSKASMAKKQRGGSASGKSKAREKVGDAKSKGRGDSTDGKRVVVKPRAVLKPDAKEAVLLMVSTFDPYVSLVKTVLKLATVRYFFEFFKVKYI